MSTYTPIASITLGSAQSSITFSNIPQTYTDLRLIINASATSGTQNTDLRFNNDTGSNYSTTYLTGTGAAASSGRASNATEILVNYYGYLDTVAGATNYVIDIQNYSNTTTNKILLSRSNNAANGTAAVVGLWRSTAAINRIDILITASTFTSGSTFNLYGIANASITNTAKATGGDSVTTDGTYWYHTFRSSGIFTPTQALTADYLVVAGGGGGGKDNISPRAGGGGGGGYRTSIGGSALSLTAQAYTVTVGAGGVGSTSDSQSASVQNGSNSVFASITSTGGGGGGQGYHNVSNDSANNGATGGSGGGAGMGGGPGLSITGAAGNAGSYSPVEGFAGGNSNVWDSGFTSIAAGGGGGAGAVGVNGAVQSSSSQGGAGGAGASNSISGSAITYAGGGGAQSVSGSPSQGAGGAGGGGAASSGGTGTAGTANLGGGGGAGATGGAGGSGIVIIRYAV